VWLDPKDILEELEEAHSLAYLPAVVELVVVDSTEPVQDL